MITIFLKYDGSVCYYNFFAEEYRLFKSALHELQGGFLYARTI